MRLFPLLPVAMLAGSVACGSSAQDGAVSQGDQALGEGSVFVRSDTVDMGRAPWNTRDLSHLVAPDFSSAHADANAVIAELEAKPGSLPVYLGNVHSWVYDADAAYRANVHALAARVHEATGARVLLYFEEQNFSHAPTVVRVELAPELRALSTKATLLMATYASGAMSRADVRRDVKHFHDWYAGHLGVSLGAMMIDVDTSQTPAGAYYGTRGRLANFDDVIRWALDDAYALHFGGFHTIGNARAVHGTEVAADSTYVALDRAWAALEAAHPEQAFEGTGPR